MGKERNSINGLGLGFFLVTLISVPAMSMGEKSAPPSGSENSQEQSSSKPDSSLGTFSDVTLSDVGKWIQRTGNRVGDEITKATSKTASAIKKVVSGDKKEERSKENP